MLTSGQITNFLFYESITGRFEITTFEISTLGQETGLDQFKSKNPVG